jgi:3-isopropylmalate/(R)-2-methylmalate dehydratase small subunit
MEKFTVLTAIAAPLPIVNIDTDMIIPKQFLKTIKRDGLKTGLFYDLRFDENGVPRPDFILHQPEYAGTKILVTGANFGCGSSREHAPWALTDYGIRCVISSSFADIFYNNCFSNGILPLKISDEAVRKLILDLQSFDNKIITVDLANQEYRYHNQSFSFDIDPQAKKRLLEGLDNIGLSLQYENAVTEYERYSSLSILRQFK